MVTAYILGYLIFGCLFTMLSEYIMSRLTKGKEPPLNGFEFAFFAVSWPFFIAYLIYSIVRGEVHEDI